MSFARNHAANLFSMTRGFLTRTLAACLALGLLGATPAFAEVIKTLYDTGVANNGVVLSDGVVDPHYTLVSVPNGLPLGPSAYVAMGGVLNQGVWMPDSSTSQWISPQADQDTFGPPMNVVGDFTYQTKFNLTGMSPKTAIILGEWACDNEGVEILLNGINVADITSSSFGSFERFTIDSGFVSGINTLDFIVDNTPGGSATSNPTGLRVEMSGTADAVPEPSTRALLGFGAIGLLGFAWRRQRSAKA